MGAICLPSHQNLLMLSGALLAEAFESKLVHLSRDSG